MKRKSVQMQMFLAFLLMVCGGANFATPVFANSPSTITAAGAEAVNHAFEQGEFKEAVRFYEEIVAGGKVNGHVYYNLGNAYFRAGHLGQATASLLAARSYLPRDPDVQANLKHVLSLTSDKLEPILPAGTWRSVLFWLEWMTARELAQAAVWFSVFSGLLWSLSLFTSPFLLKRLAAAGSIGTIVISLAAVSVYSLVPRWGAVVVESSPVSSQPSSGTTALFVLREGAPFVVSAEQTGWYKIQVSDGKSGWVAAGNVRAF